MPKETSLGSIGFGLEGLGLFFIARPRIATLITVICFSAFIYGTLKVQFVDDLEATFRSKEPFWLTYQAYSERFADGSDVVILLAAGDFSEPSVLASFQNAVTRFEALGQVDAVVSIFSIAHLENDLGPPPPDPFSEDFESFDELDETNLNAIVIDPLDVDRLVGHPLNDGRLLSADLKYASAALLLEPTENRREAVRRLVQDIEVIDEQVPDISLRLSGLPIIRTKIIDKLVEQQPLLLGAGLLVGFFLGVILLGSFADAVVAAVVPIYCVASIYGLVGLFGLPMTVLLNDLPLLILALGFANNMHLVYDARRRLFNGHYDFGVLRETIAHVGPACALSLATTVVAFLSFYFSGSDAVVGFGLIGAMAIGTVFVSCMLVHPVSVWLALKWGWRPIPADRGNSMTARKLESLAGGLANTTIKRPYTVVAVTLLATAAAAIGHFSIGTSYSYLEEVPKGSTDYEALSILDGELGGVHMIHLPLPIELKGEATDLLDVVALRDVHLTLAERFPDNDVVSLWKVFDWLKESGRQPTTALIGRTVQAAPKSVRQLLVSEDGNMPVVSLVVADQGDLYLRDTATEMERIASAILGVDLTGQATGIVVLAARKSPQVIERLSFSLIVAAFAAALLSAFAFRSAKIFGLMLLPNLLPVLVIGAALDLWGIDLQLASALAMTVAFGIAIDDTIHVANSYVVHRRSVGLNAAILNAAQEVGPVLVTTTCVLVLGLAPALFSWSPSVAMFAAFAMATITVALAVDLTALPALLRVGKLKG